MTDNLAGGILNKSMVLQQAGNALPALVAVYFFLVEELAYRMD